MTYQQRKRLLKFLNSMGNTADDVANFMRKHGIKGYPGPFRCPIANAIGRKFRGIGDYAVRGTEVRVGGDISTRLPAACQLFIHYFDSTAKYEDLNL